MPLKHKEMTLEPGTQLVARYRGKEYRVKVVRRFRSPDGVEHKTLTAAAKAITRTSVNGFRFWSLAKDDASSATRPVTRMPTGKKTATPKA